MRIPTEQEISENALDSGRKYPFAAHVHGFETGAHWAIREMTKPSLEELREKAFDIIENHSSDLPGYQMAHIKNYITALEARNKELEGGK